MSWSEAVATDSISVAPFWYQQGLHQLLLAAGLVAMLALVIGKRTRGLTRSRRLKKYYC